MCLGVDVDVYMDMIEPRSSRRGFEVISSRGKVYFQWRIIDLLHSTVPCPILVMLNTTLHPGRYQFLRQVEYCQVSICGLLD